MGLSLGHLLILGIVVLLFGARRLPELGAALGKTARAIRDAINKRDDDGSTRLDKKD